MCATVQYCCLRHGVCETCATFWSTKRHPRPPKWFIFFAARPHKEGLLLQKGGAPILSLQAKRLEFFDFFTAAPAAIYLRCTYWEHDCSAGSVTRCDWSGYVWVADVCGLACRPASGQRGTRFAGGVAGPRQTNKQRSTTARVEAMVYAQLGQQPLVRTTETSPEPG